MRKVYSGDQFASFVDLLTSHVGAARRMASVLREVPGFKARAERMLNCCSCTSGGYCPRCQTFHTGRGSRCRDRLCPNCGWALSRERARRVAAAIDEVRRAQPGGRCFVVHVMLSMQHSSLTEPGALNAALSRLLSAFTRFVHAAPIRRHLLGVVRNVEIVNENGGFHPHIHAIFVYESGYSKDWLSQGDYVDLWRRALGVDYNPVVWVKLAYSKSSVSGIERESITEAIYECVKYNIKSQAWETMKPEELREAAQALAGRKLFSVSGSVLAPVYKELKPLIRSAEETNYCTECGTKTSRVFINFPLNDSAPEVVFR